MNNFYTSLQKNTTESWKWPSETFPRHTEQALIRTRISKPVSIDLKHTQKKLLMKWVVVKLFKIRTKKTSFKRPCWSPRGDLSVRQEQKQSSNRFCLNFNPFRTRLPRRRKQKTKGNRLFPYRTENQHKPTFRCRSKQKNTHSHSHRYRVVV